MPFMQRWRERILLVSGGIVAGIIVAESILAILGISSPNFYRPDRHTGTALRPGAEGWYGKEGGSYVRINKDRLRDRDHEVAKPADTLRIAVLGDSFSEAFQIPPADAFWSVMERDLQMNSRLRGRRVEVINFGVSGFGTGLEFITLCHRVWKYSPDVILLAFYTGNDVSDNTFALSNEDRTPYFVHRGQDLVLDDSYLEWYRSRQGPVAKLYYWLLNHSRLLRLIKEARYSVDQKVRFGHQAEIVARNGLGEIGLSDMIYLEPKDPLWVEGWEITEELLVRMQEEIVKRHALFLVATLSNSIQVHPDRGVREKFMTRIGASDLFYPERRISKLGNLHGFAVLNLAPVLQDYAERNGVCLHGFGAEVGKGHWNREGHRLAGQIIAEWVGRNLPSEAVPVTGEPAGSRPVVGAERDELQRGAEGSPR